MRHVVGVAGVTQGPLGAFCPARAAAGGYVVKTGSQRALKNYI